MMNMKNSKRILNPYQQHLKDTAPVIYDVSKEPFYVVLKPQDSFSYIRLTYSRKTGGKLINIAQIDLNEVDTCSCDIRGKSIKGDTCSPYLKELAGWYRQIRPKEWYMTDIFITSYYTHKK